MIAAWLIVLVTVALAAAIGIRRAAARSFRVLGAELALLLGAAWLCYLIGDGKTGGGYLAGIIGALLSLLLLIAAGGLVAGALLRWIYDRLRPTAGMRAPFARPWDIVGLGCFAALAVILSALE
ncbi:hypothetical protein ACDP63_09905 [Paracoccus sp. P2]|uniref:Uncharacterized protein n=1 Tax=Paracoccus pantotrophus TaxID=82367 RepID=A0A1I5J9V8_PARPN|nr:hypothetical protein [Paracoccus pantotrophus]MDF3855383.1 hypothetical protein [Paracoccus pantotrophus]QFG35841.1 hypothetical protein ESD82_06750 [Paracoccus pantotrophus]QLH14138.1 hypothetical protein HYQ43_07825 [Paracoccus pantotrophus]RDD95526.1 hypothetical protein DTW92_15870 [Paracoccus pantotrophus]RKS43901.1 hypothetical protein BDE18_2723 [Paracoccus pantotrophus]